MATPRVHLGDPSSSDGAATIAASYCSLAPRTSHTQPTMPTSRPANEKPTSGMAALDWEVGMEDVRSMEGLGDTRPIAQPATRPKEPPPWRSRLAERLRAFLCLRCGQVHGDECQEADARKSPLRAVLCLGLRIRIRSIL